MTRIEGDHAALLATLADRPRGRRRVAVEPDERVADPREGVAHQIGTVAAGATDLAVLGGVGAFALAMLPDVDLRMLGLSHRDPTHMVGFALAVGVVVAVALASAGVGTDSTWDGLVESVGPLALAAFGGVVATVTVGSHLLTDALISMGVRPFALVSDRQ